MRKQNGQLISFIGILRVIKQPPAYDMTIRGSLLVSNHYKSWIGAAHISRNNSSLSLSTVRRSPRYERVCGDVQWKGRGPEHGDSLEKRCVLQRKTGIVGKRVWRLHAPLWL